VTVAVAMAYDSFIDQTRTDPDPDPDLDSDSSLYPVPRLYRPYKFVGIDVGIGIAIGSPARLVLLCFQLNQIEFN